MMNQERWQLVSDDTVWMFPADKTLCTTEMREEWAEMFGYAYESCIFFSNGDSDVLRRYNTKEEAIKGHAQLTEQFSLKEPVEGSLKNY